MTRSRSAFHTVGEEQELVEALLAIAAIRLGHRLHYEVQLPASVRDARLPPLLLQPLVENAIRPTALGKKNWLFVGEADAGERAAVIYTIIESCRRRSIDPYAYLKDVLTRLPKMTNHQIPEVTPAAWAKARQHRHQQKAS